MSERLEQNKPEFTEESVRDLFNGLNPRDQLDRVMLLIGLFGEKKPSEDLTIAEQEKFVTHWANTEGPGLAKLAETIKSVIEKQYK